ncbi:MAG: hypothetical protein R2695_02490 [Acidimicrobiales bacterium]
MEDIRDPGPANRALAWPYNKWHNSQWGVDQAAALVFCSGHARSRARHRSWSLGVPARRCGSSLSLSLSRRRDLHRWPAMQVLGETAAAHLGRPIAAMDHVELYSCFPVAGRVQQAELGLDPDATPTLTGGMAFAGGPFNNFVYQATVAMAERLGANRGRTAPSPPSAASSPPHAGRLVDRGARPGPPRRGSGRRCPPRHRGGAARRGPRW